MRKTAIVSAVAAACVVALCTGCSGRVPARSAETEAATPQAAPIEAMTPDAKRTAIAASFPIEVPVPVGEFTRAQAQGSDAWDYVVKVKGTPKAVLDWYRTAYKSRQWELASESEYGAGGGGRRGTALTFLKGNSQSQVAVDDQVDADGATTVRVILGVGAPVLRTQ